MFRHPLLADQADGGHVVSSFMGLESSHNTPSAEAHYCNPDQHDEVEPPAHILEQRSFWAEDAHVFAYPDSNASAGEYEV